MTLGPLPQMAVQEVGPLRVHALVDAVSPTRPPADILLSVPDDAAALHPWTQPYLDDAGRMLMAYQSFLIEHGTRVILVDCAVGEDGTFPARPDWHGRKSNWLNHLGLAGKRPEDVDIVVLTHLHMDHTGWLTRKDGDAWVPTFPKARHLVTQAELDYWQARHGDFPFMAASIPDSVAPIVERGLMDIAEPEQEIAPGLFTVDLAGHTVGMMGLELREGDRVLAAINADLMHHPLQMAIPGASTAFCTDPGRAAQVRQRKLAQYAEQETLMFCGHLPGASAGYARREGDGFRFEPRLGPTSA